MPETLAQRTQAPGLERTFHPGLLALSAGGFGIGLTEFVISGLLSDVAADLRVTIPAAGYLISGYALAVVVGAFAVTAALSRRPPKTALIILLGFFLAGNVLSAWAPTYPVIMAGRIVAALCHGGFFGIGAVLAGTLVSPRRQASAVAVMFGGLTVATVLGVPFGTFIGQQLGWRAAFWVICAVGVLAVVGVMILIPRTTTDIAAPPLRDQLAVLRRGQVLLSLLFTVLVFGGLIGAFSYVEPLLTRVTGFSSAAVPWLQVLFGVGLVLGNIVGGRAADRNLDRALIVFAVLLPISLLGYALAAPSQPGVAIFLLCMGFVGFATTPALQTRVVRYAADAPTIASAANIAAFNLGNAIGIMIGGAGIAAGLGWTAPAWSGMIMAVLGMIVVVIAGRTR
ncbi:MFS transporter [Microlunatus parietis]|uniref:DHA1 family inner membrane transport protein n=1 Tax=Microlunatus parietis TaxID=682979 RepID=A0A7Y9IA71_9ACTN|nr:MFS transporter [Microlunatus parietis]NYE73181.1 DHA1 family inner membrane transport protein [Microlunatus parietis]